MITAMSMYISIILAWLIYSSESLPERVVPLAFIFVIVLYAIGYSSEQKLRNRVDELEAKIKNTEEN